MNVRRHWMWIAVPAFAACGDDAAGQPDAEVTTEVFVPGDVTDTGVADTTVADTGVVDTGVADIADTTVTDIADTSVAEIADTMVADIADTSVAEIADTTVADIADTTVADIAETVAETADTADTADTAGPACLTLSPGHARHLVVSYPYSEPDGEPSDRWRVFRMGADGAPVTLTSEMTLGRGYGGRVAFRPDGALGIAVNDDGTLGVFVIDDKGDATVLEPRLDVGAYAQEVQVDGDRVLIVDPNWPDNGGGVYAAALGCDGTIGPATRLYPAKNAVALVVDGARHLVAAVEAGDVATRGSLHRVVAGARVAGVDLFPDDDDILSALAITHDGRFALVGDNQFFSEVPNRVGVARVDGDTLVAVDLLSPIEDPVALVASPYDDAVLVVSGFADAVRVLAYDANAAHPFVDTGEPDYIASSPQLPGSAVLDGDVVIVAEVSALRRFRFEGDGTVSDLGRVLEADGYDAIPGVLGLQP